MTPPLASSSARPPTCCDRRAQLVRASCCRAGSGAPRRRAPRRPRPACGTRPRAAARARASRARLTASPTPPASAAWFSLIRIASYRPARWLVAPPAATAAFSSARSPGVVLRVSRIRAPVPSTARTWHGRPSSRPPTAAGGSSARSARRSGSRAPSPRAGAPGRRRASAPPRTSRSNELRRVERPEGLLGDVEPEHHPGRLLRDHRPRAGALGDGRGGRHVAGADVLGERPRDDVRGRGAFMPADRRVAGTAAKLYGRSRRWAGARWQSTI